MQAVLLRALPLVALALTGLVAAGWLTDDVALQTLFTGVSTMKPNTAVAVAALAVAELTAGRSRRLSTALGGVAAAIGALSVARKFVAALEPLDTLLWSSGGPQAMSLGTAVCLLALGLGQLLHMAWPSRPTRAQVAVLAASGSSLVGLSAYSFGAPSLASSSVWSTMALPTALSTACLCLAALHRTRDGAWTAPFVGDTLTARLARRLAALVVVVPWASAQLTLRLSDDAASAVIVAAQTLVLTVIVLLVGLQRFAASVARSELDLAATFDSIADAVLVTDARGRVRRINPVAARLTGWTRDEALGRHAHQVFDVIDGRTHARVESAIDQVLRHDAPVALDNHALLVDRSGATRAIADSGAPIRDASGRVDGAVLVFRDMTEEDAIRRRLEETKSLLEAVVSATPFGLVASRDDGQVLFANPAASKLLGRGEGDALVGASVFALVPPEDVVVARARIDAYAEPDAGPARRARPRRPSAVDARAPTPAPLAAQPRPMTLDILQPLTDVGGLEQRLVREMSYVRALSEFSRRLAEASFDLDRILRDSVELASPADDDVAIALVFAPGPPRSLESRAVHASDARLAGLARSLETRLEAGPVARRVFAGGEALELDVARADGEDDEGRAFCEAMREVGIERALLIPMRAHGQSHGVLVLARASARAFDADERRFVGDLAARAGLALSNARAHEATQAALAAVTSIESQLRHSQKLEAMGRLAGGVAHDFNNLLSVVLTLSDLLLGARTPDDPEYADLKAILDAGQRGAELTQQLLVFSRKQVVQTRTLALDAVVREARPLLQRMLGEDVRLELDLSSEPTFVRSDAGLLTQVLMNLVVNARDVMPNGGQITVRTWVMRLGGQAPSSAPLDVEQGEFVCLAVEDQGSGIPPEVMGRLFEPFFTTKARGKGTGLGLSTSYGIAAQAGGSITADNIEGGGARFTVWLPRVAEESAASAERERPVRSRPAAHILVVEDEPALREVVRRLLVAARHEVYTADSVASARAVAERLGRIDLLLTDGILPDGTGREVADALAALPPERAPRAVLYMSGYTDDDILERGIRAGDARFLPKPFLPEALLRAVDDALEG